MCDIGDIKLVTIWYDGKAWSAIAYMIDCEDLVPVESGMDNHFLIELLAYDVSQEKDLVTALSDSYYNATVEVKELGYYNASI
jgi:hypothetical protein